MKKIVGLMGTFISMNAAVGMVNTSDMYNSQKYGNQNSGSSPNNNRSERISSNRLLMQETVDNSETIDNYTKEEWIKLTEGASSDSQKKLLSNLEIIMGRLFKNSEGNTNESLESKLMLLTNKALNVEIPLTTDKITALRKSLNNNNTLQNKSTEKLIFQVQSLLQQDGEWCVKNSWEIEYDWIVNGYKILKTKLLPFRSNSSEIPPERRLTERLSDNSATSSHQTLLALLPSGHSNSENDGELKPQKPSLCSRFCDACFNLYRDLIQRMGACLRPQSSLNSGFIEAEQWRYESVI